MDIELNCNKIPYRRKKCDGMNARVCQGRQPTDRMAAMFSNSDLIVTARHDKRLVGLCRCLTDWVWCRYLADLAVDPEFIKRGIGRRLLEKVKETVGQKTAIVLLSLSSAVNSYPKVGFEKGERAFVQQTFEIKMKI